MVDDANFDRASFWVKTHGLQSRRMCKENVEVIGNTLGKSKACRGVENRRLLLATYASKGQYGY